MIISRSFPTPSLPSKEVQPKLSRRRSSKRTQTSPQRKSGCLKRGKRSPTPYNLYFREQCEMEKKENPGIQFVELSAQIARRWKVCHKMMSKKYERENLSAK